MTLKTYPSIKYVTYALAALVAALPCPELTDVCAQMVTDGDDDITLSETTTVSRTVLTLTGGNDTVTIPDGVVITSTSNNSDAGVIAINGNMGVTINNNGTVRYDGRGALADAFVIRNSTGSVVINNTGSILNQTELDPARTGISAAIQIFNFVENGNDLTTLELTNSGTIASDRQAFQFGGEADSSTVLNQAGGLIQGNAGMNVGANNNALVLTMGRDTVINEREATISGLIDLIEGEDSLTNNGILLDGTRIDLGEGDDVLVNTGSITGNIFGDAGDDEITNSGTLIGLADGSALAAITIDGGSDAVTNEALGTIAGASGQDGVLVTSNAASTLVNAGAITGDIGISVASGAATGGITNRGTITGLNGTAIALSSLADVTPIVIDGGRIVGDVLDIDIAAGRSPVTVIGSGFVTEGDFAVSDLVINAGQDFTISAGNTVTLDTMSDSSGTLQFELGETAEGFLNVTGAGQGINLTGADVAAVVDIDRPLAEGDEIRVGTGNAALIGQNGAAGQSLTQVDNDSLLFDFSIADGGQSSITTSGNGNDLFFLVTQTATAAESASTSNAQASGVVIDTLTGITDPSLNAVLTEVGGASTPEELEAVLQATLPQIDRSTLLVADQLTLNTVRLVSDRVTQLRRHAPAGTELLRIGHHAGGTDASEFDALADEQDGSLHGFQAWGQIFVQDLRQGRSGDVEGFDANAYGVTVGLDTGALSPDAVVGVAVSYAQSDVRSRSVNVTQSDVDSVSFTLYGDYDLSETRYVTGDVGLSWGFHDARRFNVGGVAGLNADSEFESQQLHARLTIAENFSFEADPDLVLTPKLTARYIHSQTDDFGETGAGGAGLSVANADVDVLELGVGLDLGKNFTLSDGSILSPEINVGYRYDILDEDVATTASFIGGGQSFASTGVNSEQGTLNLGAGLGYTATNNVELTLTYDYELRGDLESHTALLRVAIPF